jgi:hypothetical protein
MSNGKIIEKNALEVVREEAFVDYFMIKIGKACCAAPVQIVITHR